MLLINCNVILIYYDNLLHFSILLFIFAPLMYNHPFADEKAIY